MAQAAARAKGGERYDKFLEALGHRLAKGPKLLQDIGDDIDGSMPGPLARAIRRSSQDTASDVGRQLIRRQLNIQPTLTIRPGFPVRVIVNRDLVMKPYGAKESS
ncbi:MAG: hypothetical protein NTAFB05_08490 [Nitrobacter sp.]|uniref:TrbI/VirB10 family protein n=1 Tax=Nitrobacter sp. TaxID=29420 RepID=UPI00387DDB56